MCDGPEGFTDVRGVGHIAVGGQEKSADTSCVGCVAVGSFGGIYRAEFQEVIVRYVLYYIMYALMGSVEGLQSILAVIEQVK